MNVYDLEAISAVLDSPTQISIVMHQRPDGDAIGSALGLAHYLKQLGHEVAVVTPTDYPANLKWLPGTEDVIIGPEGPSAEIIRSSHVLMCLDLNDLKRIEPLDQVAMEVPVRIMIDHHRDPKDSFTHMFWDDTSCSTAEMIYRLIVQRNDLDKINLAVATCLYTGTLTDTGSFRFPSTTSDVFRMVADFVDAGVKPGDVYEALYNNDDEKRLRLIGHALANRLTVLPEYHSAYIKLNKADVEQFKIESGDTEGLVNFCLSMKGINFGIFMIEKDDLVKMSFRSKGTFSAQQVALQFNGGGHFNASGGRSNESLEETETKLLEIIKTNKDQLNYA